MSDPTTPNITTDTHPDSNPNFNKEDLVQELDQLTKTMHDAEKTRTLEEQVAYLKSKGIDPSKTYAKWDEDSEEDQTQI